MATAITATLAGPPRLGAPFNVIGNDSSIFASQPVSSIRPTMPKSQGDELLAKAEKKASSSPGWFGSSSTKFEEAGDLFQQAANAFKIEKRWTESGQAFERCVLWLSLQGRMRLTMS